MIKRYKFSNINESERDDDGGSIANGMNAAIYKGLGTPDNLYNVSLNGWKAIVLIYGIGIDSDKYIYSCNTRNIINDEPLNIVIPKNNYFIVGRFEDPNNKNSNYIEYNFLNEYGYTLDSWLYHIFDDFDDDGYHVAYDDDGLNVINVNGDKKLKGKNEILSWFEEHALCKNEYSEKKTLYDENGNVEIDNVEDYESCKYLCDHVYERFYMFTYYDEDFKYCLYDLKMNLIADDVDEIDDSEGFYIIRHKNLFNVIGQGCKLVFGNDPHDKSEWVDEIKEFRKYSSGKLFIVKRDEKYNLLDPNILEDVFHIWADDYKEISIDYIGIHDALAIRCDKRYNIYVLDYHSENFRKFLFDVDVDSISNYYDLLLVRKGSFEYVVWMCDELLMIECYNIWKTVCNKIYIIKVDDKFDLINTEEAETFCDMYMDDDKIDGCFDIDRMYPIVEYDGKYGYVDICNFKPVFEDENGYMKWFDAADSCIYDDGEDIFIFPVVINGEKVMLDEDGNEIDDRDEDE